jgi:hypothetical protein
MSPGLWGREVPSPKTWELVGGRLTTHLKACHRESWFYRSEDVASMHCVVHRSHVLFSLISHTASAICLGSVS